MTKNFICKFVEKTLEIRGYEKLYELLNIPDQYLPKVEDYNKRVIAEALVIATGLDKDIEDFDPLPISILLGEGIKPIVNNKSKNNMEYVN